MKYSKIDAVLKVTERCNINCTYCYMFNMDSGLFKTKPKQMSLETAARVARFLRESTEQVDAETVRIVLHGGEPMIMRPADFERLCQVFVDEMNGRVKLQFSVQTNATLVDDRWIDILQKFRMGIGISLDGDEAVNDARRVDHRGRGTYQRSVAGARRLFAAHERGQVARPAVLCVINPEEHGGATFRHLTNDVGFKWLDFMLPIDTADNMSPELGAAVGRYLGEVYEAWNELGDKSVAIRFFDNFYTFMTGFDRSTGVARAKDHGTLILTIGSDGTYGPDDTLRIVSDELFSFDCRTQSIDAYLSDPRIAAMLRANHTPPEACRDCAWAAYCVGGANNGRIVNRYSAGRGYESRSLLCDGLDSIYGAMARGLIKAGYPSELMFKRLSHAADSLFERDLAA